MSLYRPNVAVIVTDGHGKVLLCERVDGTLNVQTVQGGIDFGEKPLEAAVREMQEELGLSSDKFEILDELPDTYNYDWPDDVAKKLHYTGFIGQEQTFFLAQVDANVSFDLDAHEREFGKVWWGTAQEMIEKAWPQKRPGLNAALRGFGLLGER
ncbi:NUDIX domain-containing protein [Candidatus Uhrbacteria bacterium]|jgi:putative (di)nucleoside polyphosphate hydrolase|nr:NUDIX domain-containing protein [Candidatus Uhrbacteria bacterium]